MTRGIRAASNGMDSACGTHSVSPKGDGTNAAAFDRHSGTSPSDASAARFWGARAGYLAGARSGDDSTLDELLEEHEG